MRTAKMRSCVLLGTLETALLALDFQHGTRGWGGILNILPFAGEKSEPVPDGHLPFPVSSK